MSEQTKIELLRRVLKASTNRVLCNVAALLGLFFFIIGGWYVAINFVGSAGEGVFVVFMVTGCVILVIGFNIAGKYEEKRDKLISQFAKTGTDSTTIR